MTAVLARPTTRVWLTTRQAHPVLGHCFDNVRKHLATGRWHAHKLREDKSGEWLIAKDVARAARRGAPLARQIELCGCTRPGWSPPPCRAGRSRRVPLD